MRTNTITLNPPIQFYLHIPYYCLHIHISSLFPSPNLLLILCERVHVFVLSTASNVILCLFFCLSVRVFVIVVLFHLERNNKKRAPTHTNTDAHIPNGIGIQFEIYQYLSMEFSLHSCVYLHRLLRNLLIPNTKNSIGNCLLFYF